MFQTVVEEDTCFSDVQEAESEAAFWVAVSQIPKSTHPDDHSGVLKIPRSYKEAKEWIRTVVEALSSV